MELWPENNLSETSHDEISYGGDRGVDLPLREVDGARAGGRVEGAGDALSGLGGGVDVRDDDAVGTEVERLLDAVAVGRAADADLRARKAAVKRASHGATWAQQKTTAVGEKVRECSRTMLLAPPLETAASIVLRRVGSIGPCWQSMSSPARRYIACQCVNKRGGRRKSDRGNTQWRCVVPVVHAQS